MRKSLVLVASFLFFPILTAFGQSLVDPYGLMLKGLYKNSIPIVKADELKSWLSTVSDPKPVILDTRSENEYRVSHLQGARFIDYDSFSVGKLKGISKSTPIVVYCTVGYRSERIGEKLAQAGYKKVYNLYGGIFDWVNKGLPVYNDQGVTTKVHVYSKAWGIWLMKGEKVYE